MDKSANLGNYLQKARAINKVIDRISPLDIQSGGNELKNAVRNARMEAGNEINEYGAAVQQQYREPTSAASRLPKGILESLQAMPPQDMNDTYGMSVLDNFLPPEMLQQNQNQNQRQQLDEDIDYGQQRPLPSIDRMINELKGRGNSQPQQQVYSQPQQMSSGGIDYSIIRLLIKEAIAEEFKSLKKTMLNESKNQNGEQVLIVKVGKDLQLVTGKGDVYSGNMKLTQKIV